MGSASGQHGDAARDDELAAIGELVRDLGDSGRDATREEIRRLRTYFAEVALRRQPNFGAADDDIGGWEWSGQRIRGGQLMERLGAKYLYHVEHELEWPIGTTPDEYLESLERVIRNQSGGVYLDRAADGAWRIGFVARSGRWRGAEGGPDILVTFLAERGLWLTGFQPRQGRAYVERGLGAGSMRWLRRPS
jgi:hypothetical protein